MANEIKKAGHIQFLKLSSSKIFTLEKLWEDWDSKIGLGTKSSSIIQGDYGLLEVRLGNYQINIYSMKALTDSIRFRNQYHVDQIPYNPQVKNGFFILVTELTPGICKEKIIDNILDNILSYLKKQGHICMFETTYDARNIEVAI